MKIIPGVRRFARAAKAAKFVRVPVNKTVEFLRSEHGNTTAEVALITTGLVVSFYWPNPMIGWVVEIALFCVGKCKKK